MQSAATPEDPEKSTTEILYSVPQEFIFVHFGIAAAIMIKAVISIRKERKESKNENPKKNKKNSKKK